MTNGARVLGVVIVILIVATVIGFLASTTIGEAIDWHDTGMVIQASHWYVYNSQYNDWIEQWNATIQTLSHGSFTFSTIHPMKCPWGEPYCATDSGTLSYLKTNMNVGLQHHNAGYISLETLN